LGNKDDNAMATGLTTPEPTTPTQKVRANASIPPTESEFPSDATDRLVQEGSAAEATRLSLERLSASLKEDYHKIADPAETALRVLLQPNHTYEVRTFIPTTPNRKPRTVVRHYKADQIPDMAEDAALWSRDAKAVGIYVTLNPVRPELPAELKAARKNDKSGKRGAEDPDIVRRHLLLIDCDPVRPDEFKKHSSTDAEKAASHKTCQQIRDYLQGQGWPEPVACDSGNGYHLLYKIDLPNDQTSADLVHRVLKALARRFDTAEVKIDQKVANAARITKLYGTHVRKGPHTDERPHRQSRMGPPPDPFDAVPREMLEQLAAEAPAESTSSKSKSRTSTATGADHANDPPPQRWGPGEVPNYLDARIGLDKDAWGDRPSIQGKKGSDALMAVAVQLIRGYCLTVEAALPYLQEFNQKHADPVWDEVDLVKKLRDAEKKGRKPWGYKLPPDLRPDDPQPARPDLKLPEANRADRDGERPDDPRRLATLFLQGQVWRYWQGSFWAYTGTHYKREPEEYVRDLLWAHVQQTFDSDYERETQSWQKKCEGIPDAKDHPPKPKRNIVYQQQVGNVQASMRSLTALAADTPQPSLLPAGEKRNFIALQNGLLDLDVDPPELRAHTPDWFSPVCLPYEYNPKADCPTWKLILGRILENDPQRIDILQEWFGLNLVFDTTQQKFLILSGEGDNGKSVICVGLQSVLGSGNVSNLPFESLASRFYPVATLGKLANIYTEIGDVDRTAEGTLKAFVSGEPMAMEQKGKPIFMAAPTARLTFATNNVPRFSDKSGGVWKRLILMPLLVQIPKAEQNRDLLRPEWWERSGELAGILNWALAGLRRLREQGTFTESAVCNTAKQGHRLTSNPALEFITDYLVEDRGPRRSPAG
jgi:P4 family phage/plasmid primase-like protien